MIDYVKQILAGQFEASLCMLNECVRRCPREHWDGKIAYYPFWQVAYHTLTFADYYLSPGEAAFRPRDFHPPQVPGELFNDEPARAGGFTSKELSDYAAVCHRKMVEAFAAESSQSLQGPCGFRGRPISRGELHIYNLRHIQHHTGQLSAYLRRVDPTIDPKWVTSGFCQVK